MAGPRSKRSISRKRPQAVSPVRRWSGSPAAVSLTITLILVSIQLFFIHPFFMLNDDVLKELAVKGITASGRPSPYIGYSNVLLGYLLMGLYAWVPSFPWWGSMLCLVQCLSFWALLWALKPSRERWFQALLFTGAGCGAFFIFFTFLQFTVTAILAAGAGAFAFGLARENFRGKPPRGLLVLGTALFWLSALIRMDALLLTLAALLPLFASLREDRSSGSFLRAHRGYPLAAALGAVLFGLAHWSWFQADPAWRQFRDFDRARIELQDYHILDYTPETKGAFDSVGWSENDVWLFKHWFYTNPAKFNVEAFEKLDRQLPRVGSSGKSSSFGSLGEWAGSPWDARLLLCFLLLSFLCPRDRWRLLAAQALWTVLLFAVLIYFFRAPDRITLPLLALLVNLAVFYARKPAGSLRPADLWRPALLAAAFLAALPALRDYHRQNLVMRQWQAALHESLAQAGAREGQLYELWLFPLEMLGAFDDCGSLRPFHLFLTSFCQTSPESLDGLERFGVREPFRDAVDNPKVLLVCGTEEGEHYQRYLKENYGLDVHAETAFQCRIFNVFSIHSRGK